MELVLNANQAVELDEAVEQHADCDDQENYAPESER
jgi:hypothetical protein